MKKVNYTLLLALKAILFLSFFHFQTFGNVPDNRIIPSGDYEIFVNGKQIFCYTARVYDTRFTEGVERYKGIYDGKSSDNWKIPYSTVSYSYFDIEGEANIEIHVKGGTFDQAKVRPLREGINPEVRDSIISFKLIKPANLTIEPGGREDRVLHLFANPPDKNKPSKNDKNVIYFGPGVHQISTIEIKSGQTLYLDSGAYLYAVDNKADPSKTVVFANDAENVRIAGRGILDCSKLSTEYHTRKFTLLISQCHNVNVEGIILIGSTSWNVRLFKSRNVTVDNVHIISHFFNSDGINTMLSNHVTIKNCFLRQRDDGIVMKSLIPGDIQKQFNIKPDLTAKTSNVLVENCVIWSDWGYALGSSYEIQQPVKHIIFRNCDIINATQATDLQGVLGVLVSDKSTVSDILFENINIERSLKPLIKLEIRRTKWTKSLKMGNIRSIRFNNIRYMGKETQPIILQGLNKNSTVKDVVFDHLNCLGKQVKSLKGWDFRVNQFVKDIHLR